MTHARPLFLGLLLGLATGCGSSGIVFSTFTVSPSGSIQAAVDMAGDGDTVIVEPGLYMENVVISGKSITLRSMDPSDPDIVASTVIDGGMDGPVLTVAPAGQGSPFAKEPVQIRGLTVQGGMSTTCGGGLRVDVCRVIVADCVFQGNAAMEAGGAICGTWPGPDPSAPGPVIELHDSLFQGNTASEGGGVFLDGATHAEIDATEFLQNTATAGDGGGFLQVDSTGTMITSCGFDRNDALGNGGGARHRSEAVTESSLPWILFDTTQFIENRAGLGGGGAGIQVSSMVMTGCDFLGNEAGYTFVAMTPTAGCGVKSPTVEFYDGGGCIVTSTSSTVAAGATWVMSAGNTFFGNTAAASGGGIAVIATEDHDRPHPAIFVGNQVRNNTAGAGTGGGLFSSGSAFWSYETSDGTAVPVGDLPMHNTFGGNLPDGVSGCDR